MRTEASSIGRDLTCTSISMPFELPSNHSAVVELGQTVAMGQRIGLSGNSGNSTAPHLHFDVVEARCGKPWPEGPYTDRCHNAVPVTFRNTKPQACGLASGDTYVAQPY